MYYLILEPPYLSAYCTPGYGDWTEEDISNLRGGLRKWGRAWGKIYREVGGRKTATQCKTFFDDFCHDHSLGLSQALSERSSIQVRGGRQHLQVERAYLSRNFSCQCCLLFTNEVMPLVGSMQLKCSVYFTSL